jgi:MoxR-like ATPase
MNENEEKTTFKQSIVGCEDILSTLNYAIDKNRPVLIIGETGIGKTALIRFLAQEHKKTFRRLNLNGETTTDEFVGKNLLNTSGTYWQDGVLIEAMRKGYWLLLDEINSALPEILFVLHSLLDDDMFVVLSDKDGEIVRPHPDFRIFATMNPSGKYAGTKELNKAFFSRFPIVIKMDFPSEKEEIAIISSYVDVDKGIIFNLVRMGNDLRDSYKKGEIEYVCSTRDLINTAQLIKDRGIKEGLNNCIINRVNEDELKAVSTVVTLYFNVKVDKIVPCINWEAKFNELAEDKRRAELLLREKIALLEKKAGVEKTRPAVNFFRGDRVSLSPKSSFYAQCKGTDGEILSEAPGASSDLWFNVRWDCGTTANYSENDLILLKPLFKAGEMVKMKGSCSGLKSGKIYPLVKKKNGVLWAKDKTKKDKQCCCRHLWEKVETK